MKFDGPTLYRVEYRFHAESNVGSTHIVCAQENDVLIASDATTSCTGLPGGDPFGLIRQMAVIFPCGEAVMVPMGRFNWATRRLCAS